MAIRVAWAENYAHHLPEGHRFPMEKYNLIPEQLLFEGTLQKEDFFTPEPIEEDIILLTHSQEYWKRLKNLELSHREQRASGFPHNADLIHREQMISRGTLDGALMALEGTMSLNVAGGTHHAFYDRGEGFCLLNDMAMAANYLLKVGKVSRILFVDLDVHQGNGSAQIFEQEPRVFTFSMHGRKNYPFHKQRSDLDVELEDGTEDEEYLALLNTHLQVCIDRQKPEIIFFQSGVDVLATDKLGKLGVSKEGCKARDEMVFERCKKLGIPIQVSMGGGYSKRVADIVEAHANTFRLAHRFFA